MNHADRLARLTAGLDHPLLVTSLTNIRYLTGFTGSNAHLLVTLERTALLTDGRYGEVAGELVAALPSTDLLVYSADLPAHLAQQIDDAATVDVEAAHATWDYVRQLDAATGAELAPTTGIVERHRMVKDLDEVEALRAAAHAGDVAFSALDDLRRGADTEGELGDLLIASMRDAGGAQADWPPIVAAGPNAARPHHRAGEGKLDGGLLLLDYGCLVDGYHSDMTRTVWLGASVPGDVADVYDAVLASNEAGIAAVRPGVTAGDVDAVCRDVLDARGYLEHFLHSTGHGVGLDIHESPSVRRGSDEVLEPGHVITIEPGVYLPGRFGVRIEDMVLVTANGGEVLTESSKELEIA
jgi:Xaa-Pro aminopeptidase